ncbi:MAG: signal recognition particle-docking protein FtsY [Candidatus Rokubacteria bacterium]|nr:signal recognition particle-docking protein FtsY [Candidatus Rokubacteria bacterium]
MKFLPALTDCLRQSLERSRNFLSDGLNAVWSLGGVVDEALLEELEELLISADLGADVAREFLELVREEARHGRVSTPEDLRSTLGRFLEEALAGAVAPLALDQRPSVILVLGVNGGGKTTTCGKLAAALKGDGKSVLLAAADTFRAAAIDQLEAWGKRVGVEVIHQAPGSDPAAVVFDAAKAAVARGVDVLIVDTAGRIDTKSNLMEELAKLMRVVGRQLPGAPHESLMVLDATTGQNGLAQAKTFHAGVGLTGLILTKLDGTAKGGIVVRIHRELGLPIKLVGTGERVEDLQPFDPKVFVGGLLPE